MHTSIHHIRTFAHHHDDIPAFHAGFLVLVLIAASMFSLGAFAVLIFLHMALDSFKYREKLGYSWKSTFEGMIRESLVDIMLFLIGLTFALYLHHSVAFVGISGILRTELTLLRAFGTLIPKMKILHHFLSMIAHIRHYLNHAHPDMREGWNQIDRIVFGVCAAMIVLLILAPLLLPIDNHHIKEILVEELVPRIL